MKLLFRDIYAAGPPQFETHTYPGIKLWAKVAKMTGNFFDYPVNPNCSEIWKLYFRDHWLLASILLNHG